jgi:NitT/TauT family transport system substrate-binding protein
MKRIVRISAMLVLAVTVLATCGPREVKKPPDEVTVQLAWTHRALFAGFYAADQQGYYAEEGLAVSLLPRSDPAADVNAPVMGGTAEFGVDYGAGLILARAQGLPVTAIATIYRRHPLVFITLADSGITRPQDFPGHTVRTLTPGSSEVAFRAMMTRLGLDPDSVKQVDVGFDLSPFLAGDLDIWPGFLNSEVLDARRQGYEVNLILPEDYGVHLYGYTLYTTDQLIEENPDLVLRFLRATLRGWQWAVENPEKAGPLALKYDPTLDAAHQVAIMEASVPLIHTGEDHIGWMRAEVWQGMHEMLLEQGILDEPVDLDKVYTMEFLHETYGGE